MKSGTIFAGKDGVTVNTADVREIPATGAMSRRCKVRRQLCQKLTLFPSVGAGDAMIPIASRAGMSAARSIPIIAVTSYALSREEKKARAAGCDDFMPKPFSPRQLLAKIRQFLQ